MTKRLHLNLRGKPACDRQLSLHRQANASIQDTMVLAPNAEAFMVALKAPKPTACRHCARAVDLLSPVTRQQREPLYDMLEAGAVVLDSMGDEDEGEEETEE